MIVGGILAVAVAASMCLPVRWAMLRLQVIDVPNLRSSHVLPTVRGGGIAVAVGALAAMPVVRHESLSSLAALLTASVLFGLMGLVDDFLVLSVKGRLVLQLNVAAMAVTLLFPDDASGWLRLVFSVAAVVWIVGYVNAFNFMDGINGISSVTAVITGGTMALLGWVEHARSLTSLGVVIAAAAVGFLPFNFPNAKLFLGDVGSYFIGAWLAVSAIVGLRAGIAPEAVLAPFGVYLADTSVTLLRRIRRGDKWYESHREHTYQRLAQAGWSHRRTTAFVGLVTILCSAIGLLSARGGGTVRLGGAAAIAALLVGYLHTPELARSPLPTKVLA